MVGVVAGVAAEAVVVEEAAAEVAAGVVLAPAAKVCLENHHTV